MAAEGKQADLIAGNNVYAHVPDINDFTRGLKAALKPGSTVTLEFPHLMRLIEFTQFDTVYHEHFSYLSLFTVAQDFQGGGLRVCDVEELPTHGGSLRVYAQRAAGGAHARSARVDALLRAETAAGMTRPEFYAGFQAEADRVKNDFHGFLIDAKRQGKLVAGYGAAAKGNTLMNYAGVRPDLIAFVVDRNPAKQGKYMPGSRIPIVDESRLESARPDYVVLLPWNLRAELIEQLRAVRAWGGRFVTAVPRLEIA